MFTFPNQAWILFAAGFIAISAPYIARAESQTNAKTAEARMMNCAGGVAAALKSKMLDTVRPEGKGIRVVAGPGFFKAKLTDRRKIITNINCLAMGGNGGAITFDVLHWQTGQRIGQFVAGKFEMD
jgi:hypothetical protein